MMWAEPKNHARYFGGSKAPAAPPPPPPPTKTDAEIQSEKAKVTKVARARKGRGASILTDETAGFLQPGDEKGQVTLGG